MRTKQGLVALLSCSAVAFGGIAADTAAAKTTVHHKATKKSKRCKILLVNGIHRCKGEHAIKKVSSSSSTAPTASAPLVTVTINNNPPAPAAAPTAAPAAAPAAPASPNVRQQVLDEINAAIATASKKDAGKLSDAAKKLTDSLLGNGHGPDGVKQAVDKLNELLRDPKSSVSDATLQSWISRLVASAQQ